MSNDLPTPLRDLSVRTFLCGLINEIAKKLGEGDNLKKIALQGELQSIAKNFAGDSQTNKLCQKISKWADRVSSPEVLESQLLHELGRNSKRGVSIDLDEVRDQYLIKALNETFLRKEPGSLLDPRHTPYVMLSQPLETIVIWIKASIAIRDWTHVRKKLLAEIDRLEIHQSAKSAVDQVGEQSTAIAQRIENAAKRLVRPNGLFGNKKTVKPAKELAKELREVNELLGSVRQQADSVRTLIDNNLSLVGSTKDILRDLVERVDHIIKAGDKDWPPKILSKADRIGIDLEALLKKSQTDSRQVFLDLKSSGNPGSSYIDRLSHLTQMIYLCMNDSGSGDDVTARKEFESFVSDMFEPYGNVDCFWMYDDQVADYVEKNPVGAFEVARCEKIAILLRVDKNQEPIFIQKGIYCVPNPIPPVAVKLKKLSEQLKQCNAHDQNAIETFQKLISKLEGLLELKDYWQASPDKELLWKVMSSVTSLVLIGPCQKDSTNDVYATASDVWNLFVDGGFCWETLDAKAVEEHRQPENPEWAIVSLPLEGEIKPKTPQVATHQPCGLRAPDGKFLLPPNKWLVVAPSLLEGYKLLSCLYRCTPERDYLIRLSADWEGFELWGVAVASHHHGEPDKDVRDRMAFKLFEAAYRRKDDEKHGPTFTKIACQLSRCLRECEVDLWPRLDGESLEGGVLTMDEVEKRSPEIEWEIADKPQRSVLRVDRFAFAGKQAKLQLSLGKDFSGRAKAWMELSVRIANEEAASSLDGLASIRNKVNILPASDSVEIDDRVTEIENELKEWLKSKEGEQALNTAVSQIRSDPGVPISRLWIDLIKLLVQTEDFEIFPTIPLHEDRYDVSWSSESSDPPGIVWQFDASVPVGQLVEQEVQFSLDVARAAGTFSLGPETPASPISEAHGLVQLEKKIINSELKAAAEQLRKISIESSLIESSLTEKLRLEDAVKQILSLLTEETVWVKTSVEWRDGLLAGMRRWCKFFNYQIRPETFTYVEGILPPAAAEQLPAVFRDDVTVGRALVTQFGVLDRDGKEIIVMACEVSAGPAPVGYDQLIGKLESIDELKHLVDLASGWPAQRLKSERALKNAIKGEFFDELFKSLEALGGDERAVELQKTFAEILKSELSAFLFSPTRIGDIDEGWLKPVNRSETMSGKIKKVIKPGLRDNKGLLIAPAVVELD